MHHQNPSRSSFSSIELLVFLFDQVAKLQRASLHRPVKVEVSHKFATPKSLVQQYCFVPAKHKDCYLAYVLNEFAGQTILVFAATCNGKSIRFPCFYCRVRVRSF